MGRVLKKRKQLLVWYGAMWLQTQPKCNTITMPFVANKTNFLLRDKEKQPNNAYYGHRRHGLHPETLQIPSS